MADAMIVPVIAASLLAAGLRLKSSVPFHIAAPFLSLALLLTTRGFLQRLLPAQDNVLAIAQDVCLFACVVAAFLTPPRPVRFPDLFLGGFLLFAAVTMLHPGLPSLSSAVAGFRLTGAYLLAYFVGRRLPAAVEELAASVLILSVPGLVLAIRQASLGLSPAELKAVAGEYATYLVGSSQRLIGSMATGQEFAFHLVLLTMLAAYLGMKSHGSTSWVYYAVLVAVLLPLQFVALQRSALLATVVGIGSFALTGLRGRRTVSIVRAAIALAVAALLIFVSPVNSDRLETALARTTTFADMNQDWSIQHRFDAIWPAAVEAISSQAIVGNGPGSAGVLTVRDPEGYRHGRLVTDNLLLHVTVQYGLVGLLLLLAFLAALSVRLWRAQSPEGVLGRSLIWATLAAGLVGSLLGLLNYTAFALLMLGAAAASRTQAPIAAPAPVKRELMLRSDVEVVCASA